MKPAVTPIPTKPIAKGKQVPSHLKLVKPRASKDRADVPVKENVRSDDRSEADAEFDDMWDNVPV